MSLLSLWGKKMNKLKNKTKVIITSVVVLIDLITKLTVLYFKPNFYSRDSFIRIIYVLNDNSKVINSAKELFIALPTGYIILAISYILLRKFSKKLKVILYITLFFLISFLSVYLSPFLNLSNIPVEFIIILKSIGPIIVVLTLLAMSENLNYTIIWSLIAGGGIGNLINLIYTPYSIIDFLSFNLNDYKTGILNIADISIYIGAVYFFVYSLIFIIKSIIYKKK